jgi:hypothetical protein
MRVGCGNLKSETTAMGEMVLVSPDVFGVTQSIYRESRPNGLGRSVLTIGGQDVGNIQRLLPSAGQYIKGKDNLQDIFIKNV